MQESTIEESVAPGGDPSRIASIKGIVSTLLGAVVAVAILLTLGVWFYRLGVRDAQNVPIIRAALEPVKVRPEDPGGTETPHQNITSYEVAESEPVQAAAAVIAPAPPEPRPEDVAMGDLAEQQAAAEQAQQVEVAAVADDASVNDASATDSASSNGAALQAEIDRQVAAVLASDAARPARRVTGSATDETDAGDQTAASTQASTQSDPSASVEVEAEPEPEPIITGSDLAPGRSPVVPSRPRNLLARVEEAKQQDQRAESDLAGRAANSSVQVQLAADPDESAIRQQWQRIYKANSDILRDRTLAVQRTVSGGTTFFRLRVGPFRNAAEARSVCQALKARGQDCIVARNS